MATYEYKCTTCGKVFEVRQQMKDEAFTLCPEDLCDQPVKGKGHVERVIHAGNVIYKGEGFYKTDYGKKVTKESDE